MRARRGRYTVLSLLVVTGLLAFQMPVISDLRGRNDGHLRHDPLSRRQLSRRSLRQGAARHAERRGLLSHHAHARSRERALARAGLSNRGRRRNWPRAFKLADQLVGVQKQHRLAHLALALSDFKDGDQKKAEDHFKRAGSGPIGELTSALALAWVKHAEGDTARRFPASICRSRPNGRSFICAIIVH